ncbi:MAG: metallophosphoesterase family protein [Leptolyngbyaceae cyanobacterium bins.59]|nr:metallophosphoesterase family protein [Leptolyngbyaceae cyanobacterium bins.59]
MNGTENRRIVIGDVHGHYDGLMGLLEAIAPGQEDQVFFLGDLIDRGPKSSDVLNFVKNSSYLTLLGNHEQLLLDAFQGGQLSVSHLQGWLYSGGQATVDSYHDIAELMEHVDWLRTLPLSLDLGDVWLVHAGVHPRIPLQEQTSQELCWIREEFHSIPEPYFPDKLIITGHTITFTLPGVSPGELARGQGWLGIDTGAYHPRSGWLTGVDLTNQQVYQFNVFQNCSRRLPLSEAMAWIDPVQVASRYQALRKQSMVGA